jgi:hypothetical protein
MEDSAEFSELAIDYVANLGARTAGIATTETLAGRPPSTDL